MKVMIDGTEYVCISKANPSAEQIARGLMESFWGELPKDRKWEDEANSLRVICTDSMDSDVSVMDVVVAILKRLSV